MGSGNSGLYKGTHGARQAGSRGSAGALHRSVSSWASKQSSALSASQRRKFNTASVVYDSESGQYFYGRNGGIERSGTKKHPVLFGGEGHAGLLPEQSLNHLRVGNCAEVDAVNNALNAGAKT